MEYILLILIADAKKQPQPHKSISSLSSNSLQTSHWTNKAYIWPQNQKVVKYSTHNEAMARLYLKNLDK